MAEVRDVRAHGIIRAQHTPVRRGFGYSAGHSWKGTGGQTRATRARGKTEAGARSWLRGYGGDPEFTRRSCGRRDRLAERLTPAARPCNASHRFIYLFVRCREFPTILSHGTRAFGRAPLPARAAADYVRAHSTSEKESR